MSEKQFHRGTLLEWLAIGASIVLLSAAVIYLAVVSVHLSRKVNDLEGHISPGDDIVAMRSQLNQIGENSIKLDRLLTEYNLGLELIKADMKARTELRYTKEDAARDWNATAAHFDRLEARIRKLENP